MAAGACLCNCYHSHDIIKYIYKHKNVTEIISESKFWYPLRFDSVPKLNRAGYSFPPGMLNYHYFDFPDFSDCLFFLHEYSFQPLSGGLCMVRTLVLVILS